MANYNQKDIDDLVKSAAKVRHLERIKGTSDNEWVRGFADEMEACGLNVTQLLEAVELFDEQLEHDLIKRAAQARAHARIAGDDGYGWIQQFDAEMRVFKITPLQFSDAVEVFANTPDMDAVVDRLRHTGVTLGSPA